MHELTFESVDKTDGSRCLRTASLVCEAEISEILHVLHENPLCILLHSQSQFIQKLQPPRLVRSQYIYK